jgi:peptide deformylase
MKLDLAYVGHAVLRQKVHPVKVIDDTVLSLISNMKDTLQSYRALGLAAPQVGVSLAILVACFPDVDSDGSLLAGEEVRVFINPSLTDPSEEVWTEDEGCLSLPKLYAPVERPNSINVRYQNEQGEWKEERLTGWPAKIVMHENDHLNGVLFIDRLTSGEKKRTHPAVEKLKKHYKHFNEQLKVWKVS